jgi:hypothetical protein
VIKFVSYLRQVCGFLQVLCSTNKINHDITEILLKVDLNTITLTLFLACIGFVFYLVYYMYKLTQIFTVTHYFKLL